MRAFAEELLTACHSGKKDAVEQALTKTANWLARMNAGKPEIAAWVGTLDGLIPTGDADLDKLILLEKMRWRHWYRIHFLGATPLEG